MLSAVFLILINFTPHYVWNTCSWEVRWSSTVTLNSAIPPSSGEITNQQAASLQFLNQYEKKVKACLLSFKQLPLLQSTWNTTERIKAAEHQVIVLRPCFQKRKSTRGTFVAALTRLDYCSFPSDGERNRFIPVPDKRFWQEWTGPSDLFDTA